MSYHVKSGKHIGEVRSWMQHSAVNGDQVTWGSNEQLKMRINLTPNIMEHLAQDIADTAVGEVLADVSRLSHILERAEKTLAKIFPTEKTKELIDAWSSVAWDLTLAKSELAKMLEKRE
jgi:hypothetical protein